MSRIILFQGDSITNCGRNREDITSTGEGYVHMVKGQVGCEASTFLSRMAVNTKLAGEFFK